jgi:putative tricarboxylic transport membrane protein
MTIHLFDRNRLPKVATTAALLLCLPLAAGGAALAQEASDYPSERLDWTIAFGPGGGNDIMARTLIDIIEKHDLYPEEIVAENREGGSGAVGWGYLYNQAGDPYGISTTSGSYITTPLQADTPWAPTDFTPIALLATDDLVLLVNGDSEIETFEQFIERAKEGGMTIGGIGAVNVDFIVPTLLAKKAGFEFEYVSFNAEGELKTALLSNALDAIVSNPGEIMGLMESGDMKGLAYSGRETPEALGDMPTFGEAGYEVGISMPRGLILPPDVPEQAQQWWIETMKKIVETPEWQEYVESNLLTENIRYGEEFRTFLGDTQATFEEILREEGAIE